MVKIALQIKATLENIEELQTCHPHYAFFVRIKCTNCGEVSDKWHDITEGERVNEDTRNPKGFNFYMKCRMCFRENSIDIVEGSNATNLQWRKDQCTIHGRQCAVGQHRLVRLTRNIYPGSTNGSGLKSALFNCPTGKPRNKIWIYL
ncbi:UPF0587 protein CG4646 isoform X2 [Malaya genurostris]|uniref:UPF0587 protein CG4646 isoform X2 n=1 Tax=Malaya genurostris TaxID=325434 RepID=UPI0026F38F7A|nr:UPF0587 protein CG4646 isoform X2 [Malaya genurostris]